MNAIKKEFKRMREDYKKQMDKYKAKDEEKRRRLEEKRKLQEESIPAIQQNKNIESKSNKKKNDEKSGFIVMVEAIWTLIQFTPILLIGIISLVIFGGIVFLLLKDLFS